MFVGFDMIDVTFMSLMSFQSLSLENK